MEFKKGDKIFFTRNPKLNAKHTYEVVSVIGDGADAKIVFLNLQSKNKFEYSAHQMIMFGGQIREAEVASTTTTPILQATCKHPKDQIKVVKFSTFAFRQCQVCKADLGDA
jgi:hypothetical protein